MDVLTVTAGVIAIIQIADKIISTCKDYITTVKDAPRDLRAITIEVGSVKNVLELLELLLQGSDDNTSDILEKLKGPSGPIDGCREALAALDSLFPRAERSPEGGKCRKTLLTLKTLAWPLKESRARKILEDVGRHKATISFALMTKSVQDIKKIKSRIVHLSTVLSNAERESILNWLVIHDSSELHNGACNLHEPHTGKWLTHSLDYNEWISGSKRFLWLHGIPGSGKTVLASYIIEKVKELCVASVPTDIACAYYYFWFKREKDETSQFLRWIINQLCRQSKYIPNEVRELHNGGGTPTTASLITALTAVLSGFQRIYLVIDALDESSDRSNLLDILLQIHSDDNFKKMAILATSREEIDIEEAFKGVSTNISLHNRWVDEDIRTYIQNQLCRDRRLNRWPEGIRAEIEAALVKGAKGMFRWAFCQLDILSRLKSAVDVRKTLGQLPATLFETYDRILASIPAENVKFARRALQLLAFDFGINTLGALVEAVIFDDTTCAFVEDDRFLSPKDILEICTCMITCDELRKGGGDGYLELSPVRLAHYSVKEYMTSERMKGTTFGISEVKASILAAKICVTYHLNLDSSNYKAMQQIYDDADWDFSDWCEEGIEILITRQFPLAKMVGDVNQFVRVSGRDEIINDLVLRLLNPGRPHFKEWLKLYALFFRGGRSGIPRWKFPPGGELTASLAYLCWLDLHPAAEILLERNPDPLILNTQLELESYYFDRNIDDENSEGAPLHVALSLGREWYVDLLVAKGADVNLVSFYGLTPLNLAVNAKITTQSCQRMIALLLDRKADPNPSCLGETPLQSAIIGRMDWKTDPDDIEIIRMLVDAGADVNATGNDEANIARIRYWFRNHTNHESIAQRGGEFWYKSPLLMIETQLRQPRSQSEGAEVKRKLLEDMGELLIRHGARSFDERPTNNQTNGMNLQLPKIPDFTSEGYTPALAG